MRRTLTRFSRLSTGSHNPCSVIPSWGKAQQDPGASSTEYQLGCYYQPHTHARAHDAHAQTHTGSVDEEKAQAHGVTSGASCSEWRKEKEDGKQIFEKIKIKKD